MVDQCYRTDQLLICCSPQARTGYRHVRLDAYNMM